MGTNIKGYLGTREWTAVDSKMCQGIIFNLGFVAMAPCILIYPGSHFAFFLGWGKERLHIFTYSVDGRTEVYGGKHSIDQTSDLFFFLFNFPFFKLLFK